MYSRRVIERRISCGLLLALSALAGCGGPEDGEGDGAAAGWIEESTDESALVRTCASGPTQRGIDVSYYQGTIDWDRVRGAGIQFAFIRVSDSLNFVDTQFSRNWAEARRVGIRRGVYQYFRPNQDPIAQANLLLQRMGPLAAGDLPPVIDVEAAGGLSASTVAARVRQWVDHVEAQLGVVPIVYTGPYFWRDSVGSPAFSTDHHLWVAHYTTGCPLTPEPWTRWSFHQYTDSGRVAGVTGNVDMNYFNGDAAALAALGYGGATPPPPPPPPPSGSCSALGAGGGTLEEDGDCVELGGPTRYLHAETGGSGGAHVWTGSTNSASPANFARWSLRFGAAGRYRVSAHVAGAAANSREARYRVTHAGGQDDVFADQSTAAGFFELGTFDFAAGASYEVRLDDNTGEASSLGRRLVFDAVRVGAPASPPCSQIVLSAGTTALNVRPRPNTGRDPLTQLTSGQRATRLADVPGASVSGNTRWQRIRLGTTVGYVSARYTTCVN